MLEKLGPVLFSNHGVHTLYKLLTTWFDRATWTNLLTALPSVLNSVGASVKTNSSRVGTVNCKSRADEYASNSQKLSNSHRDLQLRQLPGESTGTPATKGWFSVAFDSRPCESEGQWWCRECTKRHRKNQLQTISDRQCNCNPESASREGSFWWKVVQRSLQRCLRIWREIFSR